MFEHPQPFVDRREAGRLLGEELAKTGWRDPLVLALPRGGVPVGYEVARALRAPLDVLLVRKIGAPGHPEFALGAVVDGEDPQMVVNEEAALILGPSSEYLEMEKRRQLAEIERRRKQYVGDRPAQPIAGRTAIVVDDGIATGSTVKVALKALRRTGAARLVVAVPVAPPGAVAWLRQEADDVICLDMPKHFRAVSLHYVDFEQTTDEEVTRLLKSAASAPAG